MQPIFEKNREPHTQKQTKKKAAFFLPKKKAASIIF